MSYAAEAKYQKTMPRLNQTEFCLILNLCNDCWIHTINNHINLSGQPMFLLALYVGIALGVSFLYSLLEATLLSLTPAHMAPRRKIIKENGARCWA